MPLQLRLPEDEPTPAVPVCVTLAPSERIAAVEKLAEVLAKAVSDVESPPDGDGEEADDE